MLRGCLEASFYTGQLGPHSSLDPSPMRCDGAIANLSFLLSPSFTSRCFLHGTNPSREFVSVLSLKFNDSIRIGSVTDIHVASSRNEDIQLTNEREKFVPRGYVTCITQDLSLPWLLTHIATILSTNARFGRSVIRNVTRRKILLFCVRVCKIF